MIRPLFVFAIGALLLGGCSSSDNNSPPPPVTPEIVRLDIEPKIATLDVGTSDLYRALATDVEGRISDVTNTVQWSLEGQSGIVEISNNPAYPESAFVLAVSAGQDNIVAQLGGVSTTSAITVVDVQLVDLAVSPAGATLPTGATAQFSAEGTYDDGHVQDLTDESTWTAADPAIASVSNQGLVTALSEGSTAITATLNGFSDDANMTVRDPVEVESVEVTPQDVEMLLDGDQQFNARVHYTDGSTQVITGSALWISSSPNVVVQAPGSRKGQFIALSEGSATITAELDINNTGQTQVTVTKLFILGIQISPSIATLAVGETRRFFTEAIDSAGRPYSINQSPDLSYSIEDPAIAYVSNSPADKGRLTALAPGTTKLLASFEYEGFVYWNEAMITVIP